MHVFIFVCVCIYECAWLCVYKSMKLDTISCVVLRTIKVPSCKQGLSLAQSLACRLRLTAASPRGFPYCCCFTAHVTTPGILMWVWHSSSGPQAHEKSTLSTLSPHPLISPPPPRIFCFIIILPRRSHSRSLDVFDWHIIFYVTKCYCKKKFNFTMTFYISFQYIIKNESSSIQSGLILPINVFQTWLECH